MLDQIFCRLHIPSGIQENALRRGPVPSGAARLLIVGLQALGHIVVNHIGHVGLVDAHAKGVGGHHDGGPVIEEILLIFVPLLIRKARVVPSGRNARLP